MGHIGPRLFVPWMHTSYVQESETQRNKGFIIFWRNTALLITANISHVSWSSIQGSAMHASLNFFKCSDAKDHVFCKMAPPNAVLFSAIDAQSL